MKDLAEKACWDVAETRAKGERQLLEYLVSICCIYNQMSKDIFQFHREFCIPMLCSHLFCVHHLFCRSVYGLMSFKVYLAMEAGYFEKVDELCNRYSLEGLPKVQGIYCCMELLLM